MTVPAATFTTYEAIGRKEDLTEAIYNIAPTDTPFVQRAARVKAKQRVHEWQTDSLAAAASNAHVEGDDSTASTAEPTVRLQNKTQIFKKTISVTGTQEVVDKAGRDSEIAYQLMKRGKEIKRDIEYALCQNQASSAGDAASARKLGSVESWLATNFTNKSSGTASVTTGGFSSTDTVAWVTKTHNGSFTENDLKAVISAAWTQGGSPDLILVGPNAKKKISTFTGIADITKEAGSNAKLTRIIGGADVYASDFGEHKVVPSRFSREQTVLVLDMEYFAVAQLRGMTKEKLAKTGDSEKWHLLTELTLESRNEKASGLIVGVDGTL
jgi:hypothetical protein